MNVAPFRDSVERYLSAEFSIEATDDRLVCDTPLFYPEGDSVVVYATLDGETVQITDFGEGYAAAIARHGVRKAPIRMAALEICHGLGLEFADGRIYAIVDPDDFADGVWRVASASMRLAEAITFARAERQREEDVFTDEVERALRERQIPVERETKLVGASGHEYTPALFLPAAELVVEPISPEVAWVRAASVYAEFGDIAQSNGYKLIAVVDDREGAPSDEITGLLVQVGGVAKWSRRETWIRSLRDGAAET